jgi:EAL domain-containing protein (putative c-di-GMP-specific phosphodiesterase class I)
MEGAEALMRWTHPTIGPIAADRFIPAAEETGAVDELTRWALRQAIDDQARLAVCGVATPISINISGKSLCDEAFCAFAIDAVGQSNAKMCFEITETAIIEDPVTAMATVALLRQAGIQIAIDDYGSGLSSLSYLKQIAADELKLDRSLIADIATSARDRLIVRSTIELAHSIGLKVVAEGIEDEISNAILASMGCDSVQGYWISRPLVFADFVSYALRNKDADPDERFLNDDGGVDVIESV